MARSKGGRPSRFTKEVRDALLAALAGGSTVKDACALAGVGETTYRRWLAIGKALSEGVSHPEMPRLVADREEFRGFWGSIKKAEATGRFRGVTNVQAAGRDRWIHHKTGQVRTVVPPPLTWMNRFTGELSFEDPLLMGADPEEWERQWSGEAWTCERGDWRAIAWFLERSDFDNWGRRSRQDVVLDWRVEAVQVIVQQRLSFEIVEQEVGTDLALELFRAAGVPVVRPGKDVPGDEGEG